MALPANKTPAVIISRGTGIYLVLGKSASLVRSAVCGPENSETLRRIDRSTTQSWKSVFPRKQSINLGSQAKLLWTHLPSSIGLKLKAATTQTAPHFARRPNASAQIPERIQTCLPSWPLFISKKEKLKFQNSLLLNLISLSVCLLWFGLRSWR